MPKLPGINHLQAIKALEKAGFRLVRQGKKPVVLSDGFHFLISPRKILSMPSPWPVLSRMRV
jgi:hypothetical protein